MTTGFLLVCLFIWFCFIMGLKDYFVNKHGSHKKYFLFLGKAQEW